MQKFQRRYDRKRKKNKMKIRFWIRYKKIHAFLFVGLGPFLWLELSMFRVITAFGTKSIWKSKKVIEIKNPANEFTLLQTIIKSLKWVIWLSFLQLAAALFLVAKRLSGRRYWPMGHGVPPESCDIFYNIKLQNAAISFFFFFGLWLFSFHQ